MDNTRIMDALADVAELNRLNKVVPREQAGQLLISAGLMAVADSIDNLATAFKYSGADTGHLSIGESLDSIADTIKDIRMG